MAHPLTTEQNNQYVTIRDADNFTLRMRYDIWQQCLAYGLCATTPNLAKALWLFFFDHTGVSLSQTGYTIETAQPEQLENLPQFVSDMTVVYKSEDLVFQINASLRQKPQQRTLDELLLQIDPEAITR